MTPKISVIVPAYNAEKTLGFCMESIIAQNFTDFELLLVDDGSTDRTATICDDYASRDPRIRVIHQMNSGPAVARNAALEEACGDFVCFLDADDWAEVNYLGNLMGGMDDETDMVIAYPKYSPGAKVTARDYPATVIDQSNFDELFSRYDMDWHTAPWAKLFRREMINNWNIRFPEKMKLGEDCVFLFAGLLHSMRIRIIDAQDYCYNADAEGTLTKRRYDTEYERQLCARIFQVTDELIAAKNISNQTAIIHLWRLKNNYIRRVLDSLYFSAEPLPRKDRLQTIREFGPEAYDRLIKGDTRQGNVVNFMLKHHLYNTYDAVRMLARQIKR